MNLSGANKRFKCDVSESNEVIATISGSMQEQQADILILDVICFENIFDRLSLQDVIATGRTCRRLNEITSYHIQQRYAGGSIHYKDRNVHILQHIKINDSFIEFIQKVDVRGNCDFQHFLNDQSKFCRLRQLNLQSVELNVTQLDCIKEILWRLETLKLNQCKVNGSLHDSVLAFCPNLERLRLIVDTTSSNIFGDRDNWLLKEYPRLQHFGLIVKSEISEQTLFPELTAFLKRNPNIKSVLLSSNILPVQTLPILDVNLKLNVLAIYVHDNKQISLEMVNVLNQLHETSFYERLHLASSLWNLTQSECAQKSLVNSIDKLELCSIEWTTYDLSAFKNLKSLYLNDSRRISETVMEQMACSLINLEQIQFHRLFIPHLSVFVRRAAKLRRIICRHIQYRIFEREYIENYFINLRILNPQRKKLTGANLLTLYVPEFIFLRTLLTQKRTDFDWIRVRRYESFEQDTIFNILGEL